MNDAHDSEHPPAFRIAKAAAEAADLQVDLEELSKRVQLAIAIRVVPKEGADVDPSGGVFSLSSLSEKEHLNLLMETTQTFAKQVNCPLEMIVLDRKDEPEG